MDNCHILCIHGSCDITNTTCICDALYSRPLDFTEEHLICESAFGVFGFSVLFLQIFCILFVISGVALFVSFSSRTKAGKSTCGNSVPQFIVLTVWCSVKIAEFSSIYAFNRFFILSRVLFWISECLMAVVHGLEFTAYINAVMSAKITKKKIAPEKQQSLSVKPIEMINMHDALYTHMGKCILLIILSIATTPFIVGLCVSISISSWTSYGQLIMVSTISIIYCFFNLVTGYYLYTLIKKGKPRYAIYGEHIPKFRDSLPLLCICIAVSGVTLISSLIGQYFVAECLLGVMESIMFLRFVRVFFFVIPY